MKKGILLLMLLMLCAALPVSVLADAQSEWDLSCRQKAKAGAVLYDLTQGTDGPLLTERGILPEGTYLKADDYDTAAQVWHVTWMEDGVTHEGWMRHEHIAAARINIHFTDGTGIFVNEALADDLDALKAWVAENYPDKKLNGDGRQSAYKDGKRVTPVPTATPEPTPTPTPSPSPTPVPTPEPLLARDEAGDTCTVVQLGSRTSVVQGPDGMKHAATSTLVFAEDVPQDKRIAVIYAPKSGECTLRETASSRGKALLKADAGVIVPVLEYGEEFCLIRYQGTVGYVLTSVLEFCDPEEPYLGMGTIIKDGETDGQTDINIRNTPGRGSAKVAAWPTGTEVQVFPLEKGWYAVELNGVRGYVDEAYLLLPEPTPSPTPIATETPAPTATPEPTASPAPTEMPMATAVKPLDSDAVATPPVIVETEEAEPLEEDSDAAEA